MQARSEGGQGYQGELDTDLGERGLIWERQPLAVKRPVEYVCSIYEPSVTTR